MTDNAPDERAPVTDGAMMRLTPARHLAPWLVGLAVMILLPLLAVNSYQHYLLDLILINIILAVSLNVVKGFAGQVTVSTCWAPSSACSSTTSSSCRSRWFWWDR